MSEFKKEEKTETAKNVNFKKRKNNSNQFHSRKRKEVNCYFCNKPRSCWKDCFKWKAKMKQYKNKRIRFQKESDEEVDLIEEIERRKKDIMNTIEESQDLNFDFILDSGATSHVVNNKDLFVTQEQN